MKIPRYVFPKPDSTTAPKPVSKVCSQTVQVTQLAQAAQSVHDKGAALLELVGSMSAIDIPYKDLENTVFADGDPDALVMMIGEGPGEVEVAQKKPFVGRSGTLLNEMLAAAGIARDKIYTTNVVVWRPPGNRTPLPDEIDRMRPYLLSHINIIKPRFILIVGGIAYKCITEQNIAISKIRGEWAEVEGARALCVFHPAYLLRSPVHRKNSWFDILKFREGLVRDGCSEILANGLLNVGET